MLLVSDYSVLLDHRDSPRETEEAIEFTGTHEGANGQDHKVTIRFPKSNTKDVEFLNAVIEDGIEKDDANRMIVGVTGPACPEITAATVTIPSKTVGDNVLPETDEKCAQTKHLIVDAQVVRQKDPLEAVSSTAVVIGEGILNTYLDLKVPENVRFKSYKVCEELNLCIPAASELNETVDPLKVIPAEGHPVKRFFQAATSEDQPSSFPSGYVTVTGFLEFSEGGFYGKSKNAVAYSRLRLVATDVIPLGIAPNNKSEGKRQQQMMQQKRKVIQFGSDSSEDNPSVKRRSLSSLRG